MSFGKRLSEQVIGCAQNVSRELGTGFLEIVYENALALELEEKGILFEKQSSLDIYYKNQSIGQYKADFIIEDKLIIELKAASAFNDRHKAQVLNYLRASGLHVGLLLNFGMPRLGIQRIVWKYNETNNI
ncbi:MAG TPA: GxxExxY protein [Gammaproteobacteria bacterium]|nr:GxxExxY protein [Gammaproteobacteria bacterium]